MKKDCRTLRVVGDRPNTVAVESRRDGSMRLRYFSGGKKVRKTLGSLRAHDGQEHERLDDIQAAVRIALAISEALERGEEPDLGSLPKEGPREYRLDTVIDSFLTVGGWHFTSKPSNYSDLRTMGNDLIRVLGKNYDVRHVTAFTYLTLAKKFAADYNDGELRSVRGRPTDAQLAKEEAPGKTIATPEVRPNARIIRRGGFTHGQKAISLFYQLARFAYDGDLVKKLIEPATGWTSRYKQIWEEKNGPVPSTHRPRFDNDEFGRWCGALTDADLRIDVVGSIGFGTRLGQWIGVWRSHVDLNRIDVGAGTIEVPGDTRKDGVIIDLSPRSRGKLDNYLISVVPDLEARYLADPTADYPLIVGGPDALDIAKRSKKPPQPISEDHLRTLFGEVEGLAGIGHLSGRGWTGLRRWFSDAIREVAGVQDSRVEDALMGHSSGRTIELYRDPMNVTIRRAAMAAREAMWNFAWSKFIAQKKTP